MSVVGAAGSVEETAVPIHVRVDQFQRTLRELPTDQTPGLPEELAVMEQRARAIWDEPST
jgi:hypothetical protein